MEGLKKVTPQLQWSLYVDCPNCNHQLYLVDHDEDGCYSHKIFNNQWSDIKGQNEICSECFEEFEIEEVVY